MPNIEIEGDASLTLTTALLIYESGADYNGRRNEVVVTKHAVTKGMIQPGAPLDLPAFRKLIDHGGEVTPAARSSQYAWPFPRLLAESKERIVWWSPAKFEFVFIGNEGDKKKPKVLKVWIPALVWCASRTRTHCYLWAYDGGDAPTAHTTVYRPAFGPAGNLNHIHDDCSICVGSTKVDGHTPEAWERGFWTSRFKVAGGALTHTKPYACKKIFPSLGDLGSVLPRCGAAD